MELTHFQNINENFELSLSRGDDHVDVTIYISKKFRKNLSEELKVKDWTISVENSPSNVIIDDKFISINDMDLDKMDDEKIKIKVKGDPDEIMDELVNFSTNLENL